MKKKLKVPFVPAAKSETVRHEILALLKVRELSAKEISSEIRVSEADVLDNLEHIRLMLRKENKQILITPAFCKKCGFVFVKRDRLTKPGKCPVCRSEQIHEPRFYINPTHPASRKK
jgi:predicted Zn-ribbon and HTH transcriptional regulator